MDGPVGRTRHGELSLDALAELQPGMSEYMIAMAQRYHVMAYAVRGGNYELGRFQLRGIRKIFRQAAKTRPKYREALEQFAREYLDPIDAAMVARSREAFEHALQASVLAGDAAHQQWGYAYIRYRIPGAPPVGYVMSPDESEAPPR